MILEQKSREQDIIIANMSQQISSNNFAINNLMFHYCCGCWLWYITDFKAKINMMEKNPQIIHYSPGFYTSPNGYKYVFSNMFLKSIQENFFLIQIMRTFQFIAKKSRVRCYIDTHDENRTR